MDDPEISGPRSDSIVVTEPASSLTTSSPKQLIDVFVYLGVTIIEPLEVTVDSISDNAVRVSVNNLKSKDKTLPEMQCHVNGVEITNSPHFKVPSKLKAVSERRDVYRKEENQLRTMVVKMKCWSEVYSGPLVCSAKMAGYTYWSDPLYLEKRGNLAACRPHSRLTLTYLKERSGTTKLEWDCKTNQSSYTVHVNRTDPDGYGGGSSTCIMRLKTADNACSLKTDQLKPGTLYKVWVTSSSNVLVTDVTQVRISDNQLIKMYQARIVLYILAGLVVVVLVVGTAILLRRSCRGRERWDVNEVEKLDKDDIQQYETSDIIILHRSNGEEM